MQSGQKLTKMFKTLSLIRFSELRETTFREDLIKKMESSKIVSVEKFNVINVYKVRYLKYYDSVRVHSVLTYGY